LFSSQKTIQARDSYRLTGENVIGVGIGIGMGNSKLLDSDD